MRLRTVAAVAVVLVVALAVTAVAVISQMDFSQYKGLIEAKAKEATGRDLKIGGEFKVVVGLSPALAVSDVSFANAPWGSRPQMVTARRFEAQIDLIPLISGNIRVRRLVLLEPDILLETDSRGRGNWEFETVPATPSAPSAPEPSSSGPASLPQVNAVEIRNARLVYRDGKTRDSHTVTLARALLKADSEFSPLTLDIEGVANDIRLQVAGEVGSVAALGSPGTPFPIKLTARIPDTLSLRIEGQAREPLALKGYDLRIDAEAGEIAKVAALGDVRLPALGPLKAALRLTEANSKPSLPELTVEAGKPELVLAKLSGSARDPVALQGLALDATLEGREIGALSGQQIPALPQPLPAIPALGPFRVVAKIANEASRVSLPSVSAELGRDDLLRLTVQGAIRDPLERKGFSLTLSGEAKDMQAVAKAVKVEAPWDGPLSLTGRVTDAGPDRYALAGLRLAAAGSDIGGEGTLSLAGERPAVTANLASTLVDLAKLLPPGKTTPATASPAAAPPSSSGRPAAGAPVNDGRVFSADLLPFDLLQSADGELRYRAETIRLPTGPLLRQSSLQLTLRNGELALRPVAAELAQGRLSGEATLNARSGAAALKFQSRGLDLGALDKEIPGDDLVTGGKTDVDLDLRGTGRSIRAIAGTLDGTLFLHTGAGSFASRYTDMLGLGDLMEVISRSLPRLERTPLNCVVAKLDVQGGVASIRGLVADTQRLTLDGEGRIDLRSEQPQILFNTHTKVVSLLSLMPPIRVGGTLKDPSFIPDVAAGTVGAVGGILGGVLGAPGNIGDLLTGQRRQATDICAQALARATGRPAPAPTGPAQTAPAQTAPQPSQQQQQQQDPLRGLRDLFRR